MKKIGSLTTSLTTDVVSNVRKVAQPAWIPPMLAKLTDAPFSRAGWRFEPKWDGVRCLVFRDRRGRVQLISRNQKQLGHKYPEIIAALERQQSARALW